MTNLERAAAIAAERGWPLVETYRGWDVYQRHGNGFAAISPHELSVDQFVQVGVQSGMEPVANASRALMIGVGCKRRSGVYRHIDAFEAAREAMPATAFFGVEAEVGI